MNKNIKYFVVLFILLAFSISCAYATNDTVVDNSDSNIAVHNTEVNKEITKTNNLDKPVKTGNNMVNSYNAIATEANEEYVKSVYIQKNTYKVTNPIVINKRGSNKEVEIFGNGAVIDGSNSKTFLTIAQNNKVTINDLVIKNTKGTSQAGGIAIADKATLILNNCNFTNDVSTGKGGAIVNRGTTIIKNCVFTSNTAELGAAIWSTGEYGGALTVENSKFINNKASYKNNHDKTGVIYAVSDKNVNIKGNTFENNNGRALHFFKANSVVSGNTFKNIVLNAPSDTIRGAVIDNYEANFKILNNVFNNINIAVKNIKGGLLYNEIGTSTFEDNTISNFKVKSTEQTDSLNGGIIFNRNSALTVWDNTFNNENNGYKVHGGVLYNNIGTLNVYSNTFNPKNTASNEISGGAIYNDKTGNVKSQLNHGGNNFNGVQNNGKVISKITHNLGNVKDVTVPKKDTSITLNTKNVIYGDTLNIDATLKTSTGKTITNGNIAFKVNDKTITVNTNKNGVYTYSFKTNKAGKNDVTASFAGNANYKASSAKTSFTVAKRATKLTVSKVTSKVYNDSVTITGKLTDNKNVVLKNAAVKIKVNSKTVSVKTNAKGVYSYKLNVYTVGKNNVTTSFIGNANYKASSAKTSFTVAKRATKLTVSKVASKVYNDSVTITGKLTDNKNVVIKYAPVKIKVNAKTVTVKTNTNGVYSYKLNVYTVGKNNVTVSYVSTANYKANFTKTSFTVAKRATELTVNKISNNTYGETVTINGKLVNDKKIAVRGVTIKININGKAYKTKTDSEGIYTLDVDDTKVGTNNVTLSYIGNAVYKANTIKTTFVTEPLDE